MLACVYTIFGHTFCNPLCSMYHSDSFIYLLVYLSMDLREALSHRGIYSGHCRPMLLKEVHLFFFLMCKVVVGI